MDFTAVKLLRSFLRNYWKNWFNRSCRNSELLRICIEKYPEKMYENVCAFMKEFVLESLEKTSKNFCSKTWHNFWRRSPRIPEIITGRTSGGISWWIPERFNETKNSCRNLRRNFGSNHWRNFLKNSRKNFWSKYFGNFWKKFEFMTFWRNCRRNF